MAWFVDQLNNVLDSKKGSGKFLPPQTTPELAEIQDRLWKSVSEALGTPFSALSAKPVGEFLADFITPRTPREAQSAAVMAIQPGYLAANFRSPEAIQALRKMMAQEQKMRGPIAHDISESGKLIPTEWATPGADLFKAPRASELKADPIDQILRGSWYHGMSGKAREVVADKLPDFYGAKQWYPRGAPHIPLGERFLTSASEIGFPISHHDAASISNKLGEPSGISLSMLPTKAKQFSSDEYIHRVLPMYGGPPTKRALNLTGQEGRTTLNDAYDVVLNRSLQEPGLYTDKALLDYIAGDVNRVGAINKGYLETLSKEQLNEGILFPAFNDFYTNTGAFNKNLSNTLQSKGYRGILYNPLRWDEYEMLMLDPKYVLPLDYRKMGEYTSASRKAPKQGFVEPHGFSNKQLQLSLESEDLLPHLDFDPSSKTSMLEAFNEAIGSGGDLAEATMYEAAGIPWSKALKYGGQKVTSPIYNATPGTKKGLSQIDDLMSQNASRLGDIYNERPFASRIDEENRRRLWDLIDPSLRESVFNGLFP